MRNFVLLLIVAAAIAFIVGSITAFLGNIFLIPPAGYWRGTVALLGFAIALMLFSDFTKGKKK
ncbi:MAG: hypothetical protein JW737_03460 [Acidobacteria bacterium]|nr:hypothetical protein [Acidobacteriota bacterium]